MIRYSKYFLQHNLWLDDGFCQYFVQDDYWGLQEILDVETMVFFWPDDAQQWLQQCADYDFAGTVYQLRHYLAEHSLRPYMLHHMNDPTVISTAANELTENMSRVVIQPHTGWAVQIEEQTANPELPPRVEPEPELSGMIAELREHLDALVAEQQQQYDRYEAQMAQMSAEQKALFYSQKAGGAVYDSTIGDAWEMVKAAPAVLWKAARAFPGFYVGYLKTLWRVAQTPSRMASLTAHGIATGNYNPLKQEIDKIVTPMAMTYEQAVKYKSMLTLLFGNEQTYALLYDFAQRYYDATHPVELTQMAASAVTDIVVTVILAIVTAGAGAAANVAAKSGRLSKVAKLLEKIAATLKRIGPEAKFLDKGHDAAHTAGKIEKRAAKTTQKHGIPDIESPKAAKKIEKNSLQEYDVSHKKVGPKKTKANISKSATDTKPNIDPAANSDEAAKAALSKYNSQSIAENREYGGLIYKDTDGKYGHTDGIRGSIDGVSPWAGESIPTGTNEVGYWHTHGNYSKMEDGKLVPTGNKSEDWYDSDNFSPQDIDVANEISKGKTEYRGYVGTPSGEFKGYDAKTGKQYILKRNK